MSQPTLSQSAQVDLLDPDGVKEAYYGQFGWIGDANAGILPNEETLWHADQTQLTPTTPVTLRYQNDQGIVFQQVISVDDKYLFTVTQKVINSSQPPFPFKFMAQSAVMVSLKPKDFLFFMKDPRAI